MSDEVTATLNRALELPPVERAALVDELISSLNQPDPGIDEQWAKEAEDRLRAFRSGEMGAVDAEEVFSRRRRS